MKIHTVEQGSAEWLRLRHGKVTASEAGKIVTPKTGKLSSQADGYLYRLVAECFCPSLEGGICTCDHPEGKDPLAFNAWVQRGKALEGEARYTFENLTGITTETVGMVTHENAVLACSPDALTEDSGLEIKCPKAETHVEYVANGAVPDAYRCQVHMCMVVTGRKSWHFFSYYPGLQPLHVLQERDEFTEKLETALFAFAKRYREFYEELEPKLRLRREAAA